MYRKLIGVLGILCLVQSRAVAQTIRGQVVDSTSGTRVGEGFVLLLGPNGKELGRALTDPNGRFAIRAAAPGRYRLRSERIGFKVYTSPEFTLTQDQILEYRLEIAAIPIRLEEIRIAGETKCRVRPEEGRSTATVWDEARKALAAALWVQNQQQLRVRVRTYEREMDPELRVLRERSQIRSGATFRPFRSVPPAQLAAKGYIEHVADGGYVFTAPDAEVLFSDEFLNQHCFRMEQVRDSLTLGMIGLGFEPVGGSHVPDIRGVMWVDEKSAELRYVDFRYVNHGFAVESDMIGGRVEFVRLSNGGWIVSRFWIRMPQLTMVKEKSYRNLNQAVSGGGTDGSHTELAGVREEGGEIMDAFSSDGTRLAATLGATLAGEVFDSTRGVPLIGTEVRLTGTDYVTRAGPGGEYRIEGLPEGTYSIEFSHRDFPVWGVLKGPAAILFRRGTETHVGLAVPPATRLYSLLCPDAKGDTLGIVAGLVRDSATAKPLKDAVVQLTWKAYDAVKSGGISGHQLAFEVGSDSTGYFRACGLPANELIDARAIVQGKTGPATAGFVLGPREMKEVNLTN